MAIIGVILGSTLATFSKQAQPTANIFLRPVQFVVFPLVFSSLVVGIAGHGDMKSLGRLGWKSLLYFEVVTTLALVIGLASVNLFRPGDNLNPPTTYNFTTTTPLSYENWITHLTPKTWSEVANGELLQTLVASLIFGIATAKAPPESRKKMVGLMNALMEVMFQFVNIIIWTAPIGVCFSIAAAIAKNGGLSVLGTLAKLVGVLYASLAVFVLGVLGPVMIMFRIHPVEFLRAIKEPLVIAFTTATSEAALPKVFQALEAYGVAPRITSFVIPFGYSMNLDGSTLYLSLASIFAAQSLGIQKPLGDQILMVLMLMVSSKGVAGVRSASIVVLAATLEQFGIGLGPVGLILGVDWFMDMGRTLVNVFGNCLAGVVVAKWEGEFRNADSLKVGDGDGSGVEVMMMRGDQMDVEEGKGGM
ncbi:hypothetical protein HDV05_008800 [Chytridiales sp. JEL 0842]|nr:hypothetical protein HDV05_008800 [Chytridiales sp. JEL 0842]